MRQTPSVLLASCVVFTLVSAPAQAGWDDGYWFLECDSGTSSTAPTLRVGVDLGDGGGSLFKRSPTTTATASSPCRSSRSADGWLWVEPTPVPRWAATFGISLEIGRAHV